MARLRWKAWSVQNWLKGYKFGPIQRFRCCDHTTPVHYRNCLTQATPEDWDELEAELRRFGKLS